jgi:hypothetical protein
MTILYEFLIFDMHATNPNHQIIIDLIFCFASKQVLVGW